jgi:hypothetical protein
MKKSSQEADKGGNYSSTRSNSVKLLHNVVNAWQLTVWRLPQWGISEHFTINQAQTLIEALHLI